MSIYSNIISKLGERKQFALLIDPDKHNAESLSKLVGIIKQAHVDIILIGGSIISNQIQDCVEIIKQELSIPVVLFPGSPLQLSASADGVLLLSLISGRNPDYLIGNHVIAAPLIKELGLEVISTGYILVENGKTTSVEYISNTKPIPADKVDIAVATAMAGEMLGHKLIYLEAGSGASKAVNSELIKQVSENISTPLIVGGGIRSKDDVKNACESGADIIVVGTVVEKDPELLIELSMSINE